MTTAAFTETDVAQALAREDGFFMTTHLYWDCNCDAGYIHPYSQLHCRKCNTLRDEAPDARINEIEAAGIHHPWTEQPYLATLQGHPGPPASPPAPAPAPAQETRQMHCDCGDHADFRITSPGEDAARTLCGRCAARHVALHLPSHLIEPVPDEE